MIPTNSCFLGRTAKGFRLHSAPRFFGTVSEPFRPIEEVVRVQYAEDDLGFTVAAYGQWIRIWPEWTRGFRDTLMALISRTPREQYARAILKTVYNSWMVGHVLEAAKAPRGLRYRIETSRGVRRAADGFVLATSPEGARIGLFFDKWRAIPDSRLDFDDEVVELDLSASPSAKAMPVIDLDPETVSADGATYGYTRNDRTWAGTRGAANADANWATGIATAEDLGISMAPITIIRTGCRFDTSGIAGTPDSATLNVVKTYANGTIYGTRCDFTAGNDFHDNDDYGDILTGHGTGSNQIGQLTQVGATSVYNVALNIGNHWAQTTDFDVGFMEGHDWDDNKPAIVELFGFLFASSGVNAPYLEIELPAGRGSTLPLLGA